MRTIELKCGCGAEIKVSNEDETLVPWTVNDWQEIHKACTVARNSPPVIPVNTQPYHTIPCYDGINHGGKANG